MGSGCMMRKESVKSFIKDPYELYEVYDIISSLWVRNPRFSKLQ